MSDDGSLLATTLNAVAVALLDAGVPLYACPAAVSLGMEKGGRLLLDPDRSEEQVGVRIVSRLLVLNLLTAFYTQHCEATSTHCFLSEGGEEESSEAAAGSGLFLSSTTGATSISNVLAGVAMAKQASVCVVQQMRDLLSHDYQQ